VESMRLRTSSMDGCGTSRSFFFSLGFI
jgi:hypothetical protein